MPTERHKQVRSPSASCIIHSAATCSTDFVLVYMSVLQECCSQFAAHNKILVDWSIFSVIVTSSHEFRTTLGFS